MTTFVVILLIFNKSYTILQYSHYRVIPLRGNCKWMPAMTSTRLIHEIYDYLYSFLVLFAPMTFSGNFQLLTLSMVHSTKSWGTKVICPVQLIRHECLAIILSKSILPIAPVSPRSSLAARSPSNYHWNGIPDSESSNIRNLLQTLVSALDHCTVTQITAMSGLQYRGIFGQGNLNIDWNCSTFNKFNCTNFRLLQCLNCPIRFPKQRRITVPTSWKVYVGMMSKCWRMTSCLFFLSSAFDFEIFRRPLTKRMQFFLIVYD